MNDKGTSIISSEQRYDNIFKSQYKIRYFESVRKKL